MLFNVCGRFLCFHLERSTHKGASLRAPFVGWNDFLRFLRGDFWNDFVIFRTCV